jgi:GDP-4-dehydro-6-deoxy-D-mannose reductase
VKAFVTGASGFVGPYLCAHLRACGDEVLVPGDEAAFDVTDRDTVVRVIEHMRPEVVYHLAARSDVAASWRDPEATLRVNVLGTQHVLDATRAAGVRRVLVVGSAEEYGRVDPADVPIHERVPLRPLTPYGASKVAASFVTLQAWLGSGLETVRVRPFNHTGPGQAPAFFVPGFARRIAEAERAGEAAVVAGNLDAVRDVSDVRDVVRAYRLLMERGEPGEVYNVCRGTGLPIAEIARCLLDRATRPLRLDIDPALLRPADVPVLVGDPAKLRAATGFEPEFDLEETLDAVLARARQGRQGS